MQQYIDPKLLSPEGAAALLKDLRVKPEERSQFIDALRERASEVAPA